MKDGYLTVNVNALNFREGASLSHDVITVLLKGEEVKYLEDRKEKDGYTWSKVEHKNGKIGWIATKYANLK